MRSSVAICANVNKMLGQYPNFSKLTLDIKDEILDFTSQFEPYSDFNFLSLYSWSFDDSTEACWLNGNLVIKLPDYILGEPVVSILGTTKITESINILLSKELTLKLVPQETISSIIEPVKFDIEEDPDNFDYLFDLQDHATFPGGQYKGKRKNLSRFIREYGKRVLVQELDLNDAKKIVELEKVFKKWSHERQKDVEETENERVAIFRFLENSANFHCKAYEILIDEKIVGFSLNEILPNKFANCHFQKSLTRFSNMDIFFTCYVAQKLIEKGCMYINWEQDLGIEGLRQLKQSYKPVKMLKKYLVY